MEGDLSGRSIQNLQEKRTKSLKRSYYPFGNIPNESTCSCIYASSLRPVKGGGGNRNNNSRPKAPQRVCSQGRSVGRRVIFSTSSMPFFCKFDQFMQMIIDSLALDSSHIVSTWIARGGRNARSLTEGSTRGDGKEENVTRRSPLDRAHY